jgi:hypothetical protein
VPRSIRGDYPYEAVDRSQPADYITQRVGQMRPGFVACFVQIEIRQSLLPGNFLEIGNEFPGNRVNARAHFTRACWFRGSRQSPDPGP